MRTSGYRMHEQVAVGGDVRTRVPARAAALVAGIALLVAIAGCAGRGASRGEGDAAVVVSGASAVGIVEGVERERFAAMVAVDRAGLERMLGESLKYCHSNGTCETKAQFLANLASGQMKYRAIRVLEIQPRPVGTAMLVQGRVAIDAEQAGQPLKLQLVYTDVYELRDGVWQMVAWQSTRLP